MLDLTGRTGPMKSTHTYDVTPATDIPTLADLHAHVAARTDISGKTRDRYLTAIAKVGYLLNTPLTRIPVELSLTQDRFPLKGFDPAHWSTDRAYTLFRGRLQASLRKFLGVHDEQARLRAIQDDWTELFAAVEPLTRDKVGTAQVHPMTLCALRTFSLVARAYGWQPRDLGHVEARQIDDAFTGNKRDANSRALARLDELRQFPDLLPMLPNRPIAFTAKARVPRLTAIEPAWEVQLCGWIDAATKSGWDPVSRTFSDDHRGHAHVMRSAFRTALRIAVEAGLVTAGTTDITPLFSCDDAICTIAGEMFARAARKKHAGRLTARTSRKYLIVINEVRGHLGIDTALLAQVIANNSISRKGKTADTSMTPTNRAFCETLIDKPVMKRRFLTSFQALRTEAETILARATLDRRDLTARERTRVRLLGTSACFAALEIGGAPIRIGNAMLLTCVGEDAQIRIPAKGSKPIKVSIPAGLTKNKVPIEFLVKSNGHGCHDTILWYMREIRPLFAHAKESPYFFPAMTRPGAPLNKNYFGAEFAALMRIVVNLPMTPHQMRHGQTSLLLDKYPNEIEVIAKRIDDTPDTLRRYYGWLNALKLVERGQDLLVGLMED